MIAPLTQFRAVPPFRAAPPWVVDASGSLVLACSESTNCPHRYSENAVDADAHFICPNCGRLGQRMVEATPEQCGL